MYVLYFCQPSLMLCRCEDLSDVCTILFQPSLLLCRSEDLSDVCTIPLSALSDVMEVWRSFWCMHYTFVSPVSCYVGVKTFLMYALYFCQVYLSDVGTIRFSALSHAMQVWRSFWCMYYTFVSPVSCYVGVKIILSDYTFVSPFFMLCRCEDLSDTIFVSPVSCYVGVKIFLM